MHAIHCLLIGLTAALASGQAPPQDEARARDLGPFLDELTVGVAHVRVDRLGLDKAIGLIGKKNARVAEQLAPVRAAVEAFLKTGAKEVYAIVSLADLPLSPIALVVPLDERVNTEALQQLFAASESRARVGSMMYFGSTAAIERQAKSRGKGERPELAQALGACSGCVARLLFLPTAESRRVFEELVPTLPRELGGESITTLTRGIMWIAIGFEEPLLSSARLEVQSQNAAAAKNLHRWLEGALQLVEDHKEFKKLLPGIVATDLLPRQEGDRLKLTMQDKLIGPALQLADAAQQNAARMQSTNNLKQLALAMHGYLDAYKAFPAAANVDKDGKPLLSWRVHILPFLDQVSLYKEFRLNEAWDSEHNKKLIARMPAVFAKPGLDLAAEGKTTYLAPIGKDTIFPPGDRGTKIQEIRDGTSNTILLVDADVEHAVTWTKPEDLKLDTADPLKGLVKMRDGFAAAFADGSVHFLRAAIDPRTLHALFTKNGGEVIPPEL